MFNTHLAAFAGIVFKYNFIIYLKRFLSCFQMWLSSLVSSTLFVMAMSAGQEYLPPNKGYNYDPPSIPFNPKVSFEQNTCAYVELR